MDLLDFSVTGPSLAVALRGSATAMSSDTLTIPDVSVAGLSRLFVSIANTNLSPDAGPDSPMVITSVYWGSLPMTNVLPETAYLNQMMAGLFTLGLASGDGGTHDVVITLDRRSYAVAAYAHEVSGWLVPERYEYLGRAADSSSTATVEPDPNHPQVSPNCLKWGILATAGAPSDTPGDIGDWTDGGRDGTSSVSDPNATIQVAYKILDNVHYDAFFIEGFSAADYEALAVAFTAPQAVIQGRVVESSDHGTQHNDFTGDYALLYPRDMNELADGGAGFAADRRLKFVRAIAIDFLQVKADQSDWPSPLASS
jgi:hypothetical protein